MKKTLFLLPMLSLVFFGCDKQEKPKADYISDNYSDPTDSQRMRQNRDSYSNYNSQTQMDSNTNWNNNSDDYRDGQNRYDNSPSGSFSQEKNEDIRSMTKTYYDQGTNVAATDMPATGAYKTDNTKSNSLAPTPVDQSESKADRLLTQQIRQKLMEDKMLSTQAKNIKIITINGVVTIRGPVMNAQERDLILRKIKAISGIRNVDNQLETTNKK